MVDVAEGLDCGRVGGDDESVKALAAEGGFVDPLKKGFAGDLAEDFAWEARGGKAGWNDTEDAWPVGSHSPALGLDLLRR